MEETALSHITAREQTGEGIIEGTLRKTPDFLASTIVDTGVSLWNSIIDTPSFFLPESLEPNVESLRLDTYDVLNRFNTNYASFYEENQGLVNTASFVGGVLLPGGAALKGMKYLRSGKFAFMPEFVTTGRANKDLATLKTMLEQAKQTTQEFRSLRRNMYVRMAAGEGLDNIAMEAAIVGLLSDHPFMEDYMKDPWSNFAIWAGVGGVLGTGLGAIFKNNEIRNTLQTVYKEVQDIVVNKDLIRRTDIPSLASGDLAHRNFYNAEVMRGIAENERYNPLTKLYAERFALGYEAEGHSILLGMMSNDMKAVENLGKEQKDLFLQKVQEVLKREASGGIDKVEFYPIQNVTGIAQKSIFLPGKEKELEIITSERFGNLSRYTANSKELAAYLPEYEKLLAKESKETYVGFSPVFNSYVPKSMAWALQTAADLGRRVTKVDVFTNNKEAVNILLRQGKESNPAYAHLAYINALKSVQDARLDHIPEIVKINKDDLPVMNAWLSRAAELVAEGKEPRFKIMGDFKVLETSTLITRTIDPMIPKSGGAAWDVGPTYRGKPLSELKNAVEAAKDNNTPWDKFFGSDSGIKDINDARRAIEQLEKKLGTTESVTGSREMELGLSELGSYLSSRKELYITDLARTGASIHEIATRLDIDPRIVEAFIFERTPLQNFTDWRKTVAVDKIPEYLSPANKMLKLSVDARKKYFPRNTIVNGVSTQLDQKVLDLYQSQIMEEMVTREGSNMAETIYRSMESNQTFWDIVRQRIGEISNESVGGTFFTSVDQSLRRLEDLGTIITQTSKEVYGLSNRVFEKEHTQLSLLVKQVNDNEVYKKEFSEIVNSLAGVPGYTFMDDQGKFWVKEVAQNAEGASIRGKDGLLQYNDRMITDSHGNQLTALYPTTREFMTEMQRVGREHLKLNNTIRGIQGANPLTDKGLWIPSFNPVNKYISYIIDPTAPVGMQTKVIVGKDPQHLATLEAEWKAGEGVANPQAKLITKSEQSDYNKIQNILDPIAMDYVDIALRHSGASKQAVTPDAGQLLSTIMQNLHDRYLGGTRKMVALYLSDTMHQLDFLSKVNQKFTRDQPAKGITKILNYADDAALKVKSILLGESTINQHGTWQVFNNSVKTLAEKALKELDELFTKHIEFDKLGAMKKKDYIKLSQDMEKAGVVNPFKTYDEYLGSKQTTDVQKMTAVGDMQRGAAESAMLKIQYANGGGVLNPVVEHTGDLIHRMSHHATYGESYAELVLDKTEKVIRSLTHPYGFAKEMAENIKNNASSRMVSEQDFKKNLDRLLLDYAAEHRKIPTYNEPQRLAQKAAIAVGEQKWTEALRALTTLRTMAQDKKAFTEAALKSDVPIIDSLYQQHMRGKTLGKRSSADSVVAAANGVVATIALRIADLAHPLVNALSLPILSTGNLMSRVPQTFMGIKAGPEATGGIGFATRVMYDGVRARFNPALSHVLEEFRAEGFVSPIVSEATDIMRLLHSGDSNATAKINKMLDSGIVNALSTGSDFVEKETRAIAIMTGYTAAKRAYPGITHEGAKLFAKQFMDRTIGNYHSFQRPVMFQGTFGVGIGLFQTYMLSMAQSIYRNVEKREFKALAGTMLTQAGMFGMSSLPMYDLTSKFIGEHMSDDHYDLTTGTYRALGNPLAEFILYGIPSNMGTVIGSALGIESLTKAKGVSLYTRGDLQPRLPFLTANPAQQIVAVNAIMQAYSLAAHMKDKIQAADGGFQIGQAIAEGLSMQSLSRPVARGAELVTGYSLNQTGNTIQGPEDIWSVAGVTSRLLASRTTEEQIKKYADHLNSYYGSIDFDNRQSATESIKLAIRNHSLTDETLSKIAYEYMRTGTPTGWSSALNAAIAGTEGGIDYKFMKVLRPDSPLNKMISDL